jgi:hypothetical protein
MRDGLHDAATFFRARDEDDRGASWLTSISLSRAKALDLSAAASRAIDASPARSTRGTRRSSAATSSRSSRTSWFLTDPPGSNALAKTGGRTGRTSQESEPTINYTPARQSSGRPPPTRRRKGRVAAGIAAAARRAEGMSGWHALGRKQFLALIASPVDYP